VNDFAAASHHLTQHFGVHLFPLETPFPVGTINVYSSPQPVPTLIDVPPNDGSYREQLKSHLAALGYTLYDMERIVITHPHFDHSGMAGWFADEAGTEIWTSGPSADYLENFEKEVEQDFQFYHSLWKEAGAPKRTEHYLDEFRDVLIRHMAPIRRISRRLEEGDRVILSMLDCRVLHVPGHTPYCISLGDDVYRLMFTGDFLIKNISSNALVQRPLHGEYRSLKRYVSSLSRIGGMGFTFALPGHGLPVEDMKRRIGDLLSFIHARKMAVLEILKERPSTPYEIMKVLFPDLPHTEMLLGLSEVMGQLELMEDEGIIKRVHGDTALLFSPR
jgi:glyoxylase-like metal-dependent hydrolase (beta-lactamase superfamily II)